MKMLNKHPSQVACTCCAFFYLAYPSFDADLFGSAAACFAYTVDVYALSCPREICFGRYAFNHFASDSIAEVLNVATLKAEYVYVRIHVGIESCLAFWQIQFLDQVLFRQDLKSFVDGGKTDCWVNILDFSVYLLRVRMISAIKCKSANRYPLRSSLVSFFAESADY
jgi:hypothetical protein